jgi:DNA protecting protein DprA
MNSFDKETLWFLQTNFTFSEINKVTDFVKSEWIGKEETLLKQLFKNQILTESRLEILMGRYEYFLKSPIPENILVRNELESLLNRRLPQNMPLAFQFSGNKECLRQPVIGIIGSRHPTFYGREQAHHFAHHLALAGCTILSGGAIGIDTISNHVSWECGGNSIAVIGSGLNHLYPLSNQNLFQNMKNSHNGLILSEFPSDAPPQKWNFPRRNVSIAALCDFLFVVEAAKTSGTLITANIALDFGVDVGALPGSVDNPNSEGTNALIQKGAFCIQRPEDILERVQFLKKEKHESKS